METYRHGTHTVFSIHLHLVWITKLKDKTAFLTTISKLTASPERVGEADCASFSCQSKPPAFSRWSIHFLSSTEFGLNVGWSDMSSWNHPVRRVVCLAVLAADEPSPLLQESDEENKPDPEKKKQEQEKKEKKQAKKAKDSGDEGKEPKKAVKVKIDLEGIGQRIIRIDVPARDYVKLAAGKAGTIFYLERSGDNDSFFEPEKMLLRRWTLYDREEIFSKTCVISRFQLTARSCCMAKAGANGASPRPTERRK